MEFISRSLVILALCSGSLTLQAQRAKKPFFSEKGGIVGAGYGVNSLSLPEGKYIPLFFIAHFGKDLIDPSRTIAHQRFMLFFEPQVNSVVIKKPGANGSAAEFGVNVGLQYFFPLTDRVHFYSLIATGPHYITVHTERQAHGFIFSDAMGAGTYFFLTKSLALNTGMRIRHMSNANTRMPNHGINTVNYVLGISFILR